MEQIQAQKAALDRDWCDTSLPAFAAEVERTFAFKGLAREFRVEFEVDSLIDLALAILVPRLQPVIRVGTITTKRGKPVAPSAIDGRASKAGHLNYRSLRAREEPVDGTIGVPRFLAIVSILYFTAG